MENLEWDACHACYIQEWTFVKRTYIAYIGKVLQNFVAVIAIYENCLQQIRKDSPNIKYIIDKSDNAGCFHTEVLFAWKALWPQNNTSEMNFIF